MVAPPPLLLSPPSRISHQLFERLENMPILSGVEENKLSSLIGIISCHSR